MESPKQQSRSIHKTHFYAAVAVWITMLGAVGLYLLFARIIHDDGR